MRKVIGIGLLVMLVSSCSLFQRPSMSQEQVDRMVAENQALKAQIEDQKGLEDELAMARMQVDEAMLKLANCEQDSKGKFHIITGAFKTSSFASDYSAKMQEQGYEGNILAGPYNFSLVTSGSYESLRTALNNLDGIRNNVIETAWIYIE